MIATIVILLSALAAIGSVSAGVNYDQAKFQYFYYGKAEWRRAFEDSSTGFVGDSKSFAKLFGAATATATSTTAKTSLAHWIYGAGKAYCTTLANLTPYPGDDLVCYLAPAVAVAGWNFFNYHKLRTGKETIGYTNVPQEKLGSKMKEVERRMELYGFNDECYDKVHYGINHPIKELQNIAYYPCGIDQDIGLKVSKSQYGKYTFTIVMSKEKRQMTWT
jgi:hypothetical protein